MTYVITRRQQCRSFRSMAAKRQHTAADADIIVVDLLAFHSPSSGLKGSGFAVPADWFVHLLFPLCYAHAVR
jgi:hypothetical protein